MYSLAWVWVLGGGGGGSRRLDRLKAGGGGGGGRAGTWVIIGDPLLNGRAEPK